jgi:hypothetical protein
MSDDQAILHLTPSPRLTQAELVELRTIAYRFFLYDLPSGEGVSFDRFVTMIGDERLRSTTFRGYLNQLVVEGRLIAWSVGKQKIYALKGVSAAPGALVPQPVKTLEEPPESNELIALNEIDRQLAKYRDQACLLQRKIESLEQTKQIILDEIQLLSNV